MTIDEVHALASESTGGLTDFGPDDYLTGLQVLLDAARSSPHAGEALDARVRASVVAALASRLSSQAGWSDRPGCLDEALPAQVVVIGLPRSGTTALHQLLARDPAYQWIPAWLAPRPRPRPARDAWPSDADYARAAAEYEQRGPNPLHDVAPDDPDECIQLMQQSLTNMTWVSSMPVPDYHEWFLDQDEHASYRRYADNLRLLGADDHDRPWLLKNPSHTFGLAAMLDEFPDAVFVHIYRDPAESIVSGCSLITHLGGAQGVFAADELGAHRLRIWALAAERMSAARAAAPGRTFVDVDYRDFVTDPMGTVRAIYTGLSRDLSPEAEAAMAAHVQGRPQGRHGEHRYAAEDFGLSTARIHERMADYVAEFGVVRPSVASRRPGAPRRTG